MENLQFLDITGLEADEVRRINTILFTNSTDYKLPWRVKQKFSAKNQCRKSIINYNGSSLENLSAPEHVNYPPQMAFIGVQYNHNQPQMVPYIPNHYPHTQMYTNFHHPPIMGNRDAIHFMYQNQVYNYTQIPVSYQNHPQNIHYYPQEIHNEQTEEGQLYPEMSNENSQNYEEQQTLPPFNVIHNEEPVSINSIPDDNLSKPIIQNEMTGKHSKPSTPPSSAVKTIEIIARDNTQIIKNDVLSNGTIEKNESKIEEPTVNVWKKPWVSLFDKDVKTISNGNMDNKINDSHVTSVKHTKVVKKIDSATHRLGEFLKNYAIDGTQTSFKPRGLRNKSNFCYINSILQALLACPPLCNLLKQLSENLTQNNAVKSITMIENMCKFMNNFDNLPDVRLGSRSKKKNKKQTFVNIDNGNSFEASSFYTMLNGTRSDSFLVEGRQEDAEEFLGLLLNGLNDEMMGIMKLINHDENIQAAKKDVNIDVDDWKVMGPKNKGNVTRKIQMDKTPISDIFGGLLCSRIHKTGDETTVNIQPFLTLQLNIEKANNIAEALEGLTTKNKLEGLTSSKTKETVEAWQQVMIEKLPVVLVLHLKCFDYSMNGCTKIMKTIEFPINLQIDSKILSGRTNTSAERQYKLFSVVYHEGKETSKGHYIADTFHSGYNTWLRFDDSKIKTVTEENVLKPQGDRVPYLLFYRRSDTV